VSATGGPTSDLPEQVVASAPAGQSTEQLERVLGIDVRKDRTCTIELRYVTDGSGTTEAYICTPIDPEAEDPYENWDADTLAALAYGDAQAAAVLGLRHVISDDPLEEVLGLALLYRSVALSGDPAVFRKAIGARYAVIKVDSQPQLHNLRQLTVFAMIANRLGDDTLQPAQYVDQLRPHLTAEELDTLFVGVYAVLETMAAIQTEATGDTTIREALENA
jgi:hypothetical protein